VSPNRKAFGEQLLAFSIFAKDKPDAVLYLHTEKTGGMGGINFDTLIDAVGLKPDQFVFVNQYQQRMGIPENVFAAIYTGMDVLLAATYGEGFGITVIDAQSCGTPVIVNNFSAQPELIGDGWKVGGQPLWDAAQGAWFNVPNVQDMVTALNEAYERRVTASLTRHGRSLLKTMTLTQCMKTRGGPCWKRFDPRNGCANSGAA
jgi:glycosyltransferase involved in cell wall biosynthesis